MHRRPRHRRAAPGGRRHRAAALAVISGTLLLLASLTPATAAPQDDLAAKKAKAAQIQSELDAGNEHAEMLTEQYHAANLAAQEADAKIAEAEQGLAQAQERTDATRAKIAERAAFMYMSAGTGDPLNLDAADARELGARAAYGDAAADQDNALIGQLQLDQERMQDQRQKFEASKVTADERRKEAQASLQAAQAANAEQEAKLASLQGEIRTLVDEAAAAKRASEDAAARAAYQSRPVTSGGGSGGGSSVGTPPPSSGGAAAAVAYAQAQVGKPYRYAGAGPNDFDCSGLTMMAWRQGGVSMPHGSIAQSRMFPRVPDNQMQPGDLVLFYSDLHHVGIYVGGGMMINATHTGDFVRLQPIWRDTFQFAVRPG